MHAEPSLTSPVTPISRRQEAGRKLIHSAASVAAALIVLLDPYHYGRSIILTGAATALAVELVRRFSPRTERLFQQAFGRMLRHRERRGITGASTLAIGTLAAVYAAPPALAAAGVLMAGLGDAAGAIVGRNLGRLRLPGGKSVEGSTACFVVAYGVAGMIPGITPMMALAGALVATTLEAASTRLDDNLVLPLAATLTLRLVASVS